MAIGLLAVNFMLTALYAAVRAARRESFGPAVLFLFLPYLGFVICFVPFLLQRLLEQFPEIMRKKEARPGITGQGGGRRRADARQGRQRSHAIPGPLNFSQYFWELL